MAAMPDKIVVKTNDGAEVELAKNVYEQSSYLVEQVGLGSDSVIEMFDVDKDRECAVLQARQFLQRFCTFPVGPKGFSLYQLRKAEKLAFIFDYRVNQGGKLPVSERREPNPCG